MIKLVAVLLMVVDHIGLILFPTTQALRLIGRLSMPLFAYCVARGYHYSAKKGTLWKYLRNMLIIAAISQLPFLYMIHTRVLYRFMLNICFTWSVAILFLWAVEFKGALVIKVAMCFSVLFLAACVPVEYGLYGVLFPAVFYFFFYRSNRPLAAFGVMCALLLLYFGNYGQTGAQIQAYSLLAYPLLLLLRRADDKIRVPKLVFYGFYPVHLIVLLMAKSLFL